MYVIYDKKTKQLELFCLYYITFTFSHLADAFMQGNLQMRTMEAIKINKREIICKCYNKSQLVSVNAVYVARFFFDYIINKKKTDRIEKE